jgi:hypothetical protein
MTDALNKHGNNFHPDLPPCVVCGGDEWSNNDVTMAHGITAYYSCARDGCNGRALAVFRGLGFLALFSAPLVDGSYLVPVWANVWIQGCLNAMSTADMNGCVHGGKAVPECLLTPVVPVERHGAFFTCSDGAWWPAEPGSPQDMAAPFRRRVEALKATHA